MTRALGLVLPLAVLLAGGAGAQSAAVTGTVSTSDGQEPLAYARVQVLGSAVSDWTDERGAYRLADLDHGEWRLQVAHPGHDSLELAVVVPEDRAVRLDITLRARPGPPVDALADFEPFEVRHTLPALLNGDEVARLMQSLYPPSLTRDRVGGETVLMMWLDEMGQVVRSEVVASSGQATLDSIALTVSDRMRFRPARSQERAVRVYVRIPVVFTVPDSTTRSARSPRSARPR
jgi:TonB family protein